MKEYFYFLMYQYLLESLRDPEKAGEKRILFSGDKMNVLSKVSLASQ